MEEKKKTNKKLIVGIVIGLIIVILISIIAFKLNSPINNSNIANNNPKQEHSETSNKDNVLVDSNTSFANLKADDEKFNETEQILIDYFDDNYFYDCSISHFQEYPQIFKGSKFYTNVVIIKVLNSTDEEFEVVGTQGGGLSADIWNGDIQIWDGGYANQSIEEIGENGLFVIKGKQLEKRLRKGDVVKLYGRYNDNDNFDIDGKSYILPVVNSINLVQLSNTNAESNYRFNIDRIKTVSEYIFGKDIKISTPVLGEDYDSPSKFALDPFYKITLDNQSNANFNMFNLYRNSGAILYNKVSANTYKKLFITPDFKHYIVTTYDEQLKHVYVDYFDKEFKKIWNREFDCKSNENLAGPIDYTNKKIAIVIDNDLYLINSETGENIVDPVLVGPKIKISMMNDGIVLIGNDNKDTIMKVGFDGKIIYRTNGNVDFDAIYNSSMQIIDNKMVIFLNGTGGEYGLPYIKYLVLNNDGTISSETESEEGAL